MHGEVASPMTPNETLRLAVDRVGSQAAMANLLGVAQPTVWKWIHRNQHIPAEHVLIVEASTGLSRHSLRPDIYPLEVETKSSAAKPATMSPTQ